MSKIASLPVERHALSDFSPAAYNPRADLTEEDQEYQDIQESLQRFGLVDKLVANKRTGNLVAGHQRYKILAANGETEADFIVGDWDDDDERELNLILNNLKGRWDAAKLADVVHDLTEAGRNLTSAGFSEADLDNFFEQWDATHATDFLSGILGGDGEGEEGDEGEAEDGDDTASESDAGEADDDGEFTPGSGPTPYFQISYAVTAHQRSIINAALAQARKSWTLGTSIEALVQICTQYLAASGVPIPTPATDD